MAEIDTLNFVGSHTVGLDLDSESYDTDFLQQPSRTVSWEMNTYES